MVSPLFEVLIEAPLASAAAWFILAALQIYRDRWHTWTEAFFLFCCFFAGLYAIGDWLLFHSVSEYYARLSALVSLTGLTLAVNFFLLFTLVYVDRMRRAYWALMVLSVVMLLLVFRFGITMINPPTADAPLFARSSTLLFWESTWRTSSPIRSWEFGTCIDSTRSYGRVV